MTRLPRRLVVALVISIHMPHTWHDAVQRDLGFAVIISIHMPHTWHDAWNQSPARCSSYFNPHATYVA